MTLALLQLDTEAHTQLPVSPASGAFAVTVTGLQITGTPSLEQWTSELDSVWHSDNALQWCKGDLILYAEQHYGEDWTQAIDEKRYKIKTLQNIVTTCKAFPPQERRPNLVFSSHAECASLEGDNRKLALDNLEAGIWSRADVRKWKRELKGQTDKPSTETITLQWEAHSVKNGLLTAVFVAPSEVYEIIGFQAIVRKKAA